jgi:hypothetical protein
MRIHADHILVQDPWTNAPLGALLRVHPMNATTGNDEPPCIGIRTEVRQNVDVYPYIAVIEGGAPGEMIGVHRLGARPALDLTSLLDITVDTTDALSGIYPNPVPGLVWMTPHAGIAMFVDLGVMTGFIRISGEAGGGPGGRGTWSGRPQGGMRFIGFPILEPKGS